ncbi:MAG: glucosaminidase domain-containing protein [Chloroflexi bacterium]|nr:glucosaminidase domain-containing protein [Chloroflexota bacterium]
MIDLTTPLLGPVDTDAATIVAAVPEGAAYPATTVRRIAEEIVAETRRHGLRTSLVAAQVLIETNRLRFGGQVTPGQYNFAGLGATDDGAAGASFATPAAGVRAICQHWHAYLGLTPPDPVIDPRFRLVTRRVATVGEIGGGVWATDPEYAGKIVALARGLTREEGLVPTRVALAAGHHNATGGSEIEKGYTARLTAAAARVLRERGADVRVLTPHAGSVSDVGAAAVQLAEDGWVPDVLLEFHTEAGPRGVFGIYPDWPAALDVDGDARALAVDLARSISQATGLPVRGGGAMSERHTAVGAAGARLGVFRATTRLKAATTRLLLEVGAHTQAADRGILDREATPTVVADAIAGVLGLASAVEAPEPDVVAMNGHVLGHGFLDFWRSRGGLPIFGYPLSSEYSRDGVTMQEFERSRFEYRDGQVVLGRVNAELLEALGEGG